jgi:hypothetical protein
MRRQILTKTAKALDKIMGSSSFRKPYQTQSESPVIKVMIINNERSLTSFSLITLRSCGSIATEVIAPATRPKIFSFIAINLKKLVAKSRLNFYVCRISNKLLAKYILNIHNKSLIRNIVTMW